MAKTWVLDTETKGTGAHIAPLKRGNGTPAPKLSLVQLHPPASAAPEEPERTSPEPTLFKVIDVFSGEVLAEDVTATSAVGALERVRKSIDALVYVRDENARWRLLSLGETKELWALRERVRARPRPASANGA